MIEANELKREIISKIERLEDQPVRNEVLPMIDLLTERTDIFNPQSLAIIEVSLTRLRDERTDIDSFRYHVGNLTDYQLQAMLTPAVRRMDIKTPLGVKVSGWDLDTNSAIFFVNRAGLTMGLAATRFLPYSTPIGEFNIHRDEETLEAVLEGYNLPPSIDNRHILLLDPMNATGGSLEVAYRVIAEEYMTKRDQTPASIKIGNIISAPFGVQELKRLIPSAEIYTCALDDVLTKREHPKFPAGYIVPGLGDAGDRQFGPGRSDIFRYFQEMLGRHVDLDAVDRIISA